jgi:ribonucleoside-diphosphate reductase alpha chain
MAHSLRITPLASAAADTHAARRAIAALAADRERRRGYWQGRFEAALDDAVTPHGLDAVASGTRADDAVADGFSLSAAPLFSNPQCLDFQSVESFTLRLARLLIADKAVTIEVSAARPAAETVREVADGPIDLARLPGCLTDALERFRLRYAPAAISIRGDHPDVQRLVRARRSAPASAPRLCVRLSDEFMAAVRDRRVVPLHHAPAQSSPFGASLGRRAVHRVYGRIDARDWWLELAGDAQAGDSIVPVFDGRSGSACPLAGFESAGSVEPRLGLDVPAETARVALDVDLACFAGPRGRIDGLRLARRLRDALRMADNLVDAARWPLQSLRADAAAHRRIAVRIGGIGDTVCRLGLDPAHFTTLRRMTGLLQFARGCLLRGSRRLARQHAPFPGLETERMIGLLPRPELRAEARDRIYRHGTRNRELLCVSPWSMLPALDSRADLLPFFNLLPLLKVADAVAFAPDSRARRLTPGQYERFMRLAWAASMPARA